MKNLDKELQKAQQIVFGENFNQKQEEPTLDDNIRLLLEPDKLIKAGEKKPKKEDKKEEKPEKIKDGKARGKIPKGAKIYSTMKDRRYIMTDELDVEFEHKVSNMYTFEHNGDHYYVASKDVEDLDDGKLMKLDKEAKKIKKSKESEKLEDGQKLAYRKYFDGVNLGISRDKMPQVHESNLPDFLIHFGDKVPVKRMKRQLSKIKPTQGEINEEKVLSMSEKNKWKKATYIVSMDGYLLDGHHKWAAGLENDEEHMADVIRVGLPMKKLIFRTNKLKITSNKDIDDNIQKSNDTMEMIANNPHLYPASVLEEIKVYFSEIE